MLPIFAQPCELDEERPAGNGPTIAKKGARRRPPDGKH